jgi:GTP-binding protein
MRIKNATFVTSVADGRNVPAFELAEIAVAGKSNVGKSSFINFITNQGKLARTSSDPGRTRLINFFEVTATISSSSEAESVNEDKVGSETTVKEADTKFHFVDLPGYGYAKVSKEEQAKWGPMIEGYLSTCTRLKKVFVLLDVRHEPTKDDKQLINYLHHYAIPFTIIATKSDKLSRMQLHKQKAALANSVNVGVGNVILVSALKKTGKEEVLDRIEQILNA